LKNGVQIGLLLAGILDDLDYDSMFEELEITTESKDEVVENDNEVENNYGENE